MSFGINDDSTFEDALVENYNCDVYGYDPTISYPQPLIFRPLFS